MKLVLGQATTSKLDVVRSDIRKKIAQHLNSEIRYADTGRPYVDGEWDISISHKKNRYAIGIADNTVRVGVDLEDLNQKVDTQKFMKYFLSKTEQSNIINQSNSDKELDKFIIILWSLKEAFYKAVGAKISFTDVFIYLSQNHEIDKIEYSLKLENIMKEKKWKLEKISYKEIVGGFVVSECIISHI